MGYRKALIATLPFVGGIVAVVAFVGGALFPIAPPPSPFLTPAPTQDGQLSLVPGHEPGAAASEPAPPPRPTATPLPSPVAVATPTATARATATSTPIASATPTAHATATPTPVPTSPSFQDCLAEAPVSVDSGDNDGFEADAAGACTDGGGFARDIDSGTGPPHSCSSATNDRHLFYNYGFALPGGSTIKGLEVRLDAWADGTASAAFLCVQVSWDGGTTWTAEKTTPALTATETTSILGGVSDSWGHQWSAAELSDANFRVRVVSRSASASRDFFLDWVAVRVTYTPP